MLKKLILIFILSTSPAFAYSSTYTESCNLDLARTDWTRTCNVPRFDNRGELKKVNVEYYSYIEGNVKVENKDAQPKNITTNYQATVKFSKEDSTTLAEVPLKLGYSETFSSFDNTVDYAGISGKTSPKQTNDSSKSNEYTAGADFERFKGSGSVSFSAATSGNMTVTGGSNAAADWDTFAKSQVKITYTYEGKDLSVRKTHLGDKFTKGGIVEWVFVVTNEDTQDFSGNITLDDVLPSQLSYDSFSGNGWNCTSSGQNINCQNNTSLSSKSNTQLHIKTNIAKDATGVINNSVSINTLLDNNSANNRSNDWIVVGEVSQQTVPPKTYKQEVLGVCTATNIFKPSISSINISHDTAKLSILSPEDGSSCDKIEVQYGNCIDGMKSKKVFTTTEISGNTLEISGLNPNQNYNFRVRCISLCATGNYSEISSAITNNQNDRCPKIYTDSLQSFKKDTVSSLCNLDQKDETITSKSTFTCPEIIASSDTKWLWVTYSLGGFILGILLSVIIGKLTNRKS